MRGHYAKVAKGPAKVGLPRFAVSLNADKHVIVDTTKTFDETKWTEAASFVTVA